MQEKTGYTMPISHFSEGVKVWSKELAFHYNVGGNALSVIGIAMFLSTLDPVGELA